MGQSEEAGEMNQPFRKHRFPLYAVTLAAVALVLVPTAGANFKGENGVIAFDSWTGTSQDIGVFDPSVGGSPTFLTTTSDFSEQTPRWSPDGTKIVYMGHPQFGRTIREVSLTSGLWTPTANTRLS
jgi:hypothetical protein